MTDATEIESKLQSEGVETGGVVLMRRRQIAYAVGYLGDELPRAEIEGYRLVDDPQLVTE